MPIRFETLAVHGGQHPDPTTLSRGVPVYRTSSYLFKSAEHAAKLFGLAEQGNVYGRLGNPTQAMLEERMSLLEGGVGALASASGTSAIFSTIVNLAKQGDEIVSANNLYGGTFTLFNDILPQFGITTRFVKPQDFDKMEAAVNGRTRALYVEAIGNPALDVADLDAVSAIAKRHGLELEEEAEYGNRQYLEKQDYILAKQKEQLAAQQSKLDELTLRVSVHLTGRTAVSLCTSSPMPVIITCDGDMICRKGIRRSSRGCGWSPCGILGPAFRRTMRG